MPDQYTQSPLFATEKRCSLCHETKPLSDFYFIKRVGGPGRYDADCRACHNATMRAYRLAHPGEDAHRARKWHEANRERSREARRRWYVAHAEQVREANQRPERRERQNETNRAFYQRHRERLIKAALPRKQLRRARLLGVGGVVTQAEWRETLAYFNGHCAYCNEPMERPTQDHMVPISRGGAHLIENIVPACRTCNSRKHVKNLLEYLMYERG